MLTLATVLVGFALSKHSQTLFDNIGHSNKATQDDKHNRTTVEHDERTATHDGQRDDERTTVDDNGDTVRQTQKHNDRNTEHQKATQWSKISTLLKNGLLLKNAAQIFRATAENWASGTYRAT